MLHFTGRMLHARHRVFQVYTDSDCVLHSSVAVGPDAQDCIAEAAVLLPEARTECVKQDMACVT